MPRPEKLELLPEEEELMERIVFEYTDPGYHEKLDASCESAAILTALLLERKAIPDVRLAWFTDPRFQVKGKMSRLQIFEKNGNTLAETFEHPHFLLYLRYFIYGPDLPPEVIDEFSTKVEQWAFVSGSTYPELVNIARSAVRRYGLSPHSACEEFWKLSNECGVGDMYGRVIRDSVRKIRMS